DRLRVYGSREGAEDLAQRLAAEVQGGGDGLFTIGAPDLFGRTSFLAAPASIVEVTPEPRLDLRSGPSPYAKRGVVGAGALTDVAPGAARQAMLVGIYTAGQRALFLDAAGGFSIEDQCSGETLERGRWSMGGEGGERVILEGEAHRALLAYDHDQG